MVHVRVKFGVGFIVFAILSSYLSQEGSQRRRLTRATLSWPLSQLVDAIKGGKENKVREKSTTPTKPVAVAREATPWEASSWARLQQQAQDERAQAAAREAAQKVHRFFNMTHVS